MNRDELERVYQDELYPTYAALAARIGALLDELSVTDGVDVAQIEHRVKTVDSVLEKYDRKTYKEPLREIKDYAGVRVITYYKDDNLRVADLIRKEFDVDSDHSTDKESELDVTEFGYRSLHLIVSLSEPRRSLPEWSTLADFSAEIQIRTVLQHAWASISHKLDYKAASEAPIELRRQLFRLSALLELADEDFASLRDRSQILSEQYRHEVDQGQLDIPLNLDSLAQYLNERVDLRYWAELGSQAGMMWDEDSFAVLRVTEELSPLLATLQVVGLSSITEVQSLLDEIRADEATAIERLRQFVELDSETTGDLFWAVGADVLMILISFYRAELIPEEFTWNDVWVNETGLLLKYMVENNFRNEQ